MSAEPTKTTEAAEIHRLSEMAIQDACHAITDMSRALDPRRSAGPRRNDLKSARDKLSLAVERMADAIGMLS